MATPAGVAKAHALNAKLEGEVRTVVDEIDKTFLRKGARQYHTCALQCYDKAGSSGSAESLEHCVNQCSQPHRQGNAIAQQEVAQYQDRLGRAMQECQDNARDLMRPGAENDAKQMARVEETLISCISSTVDDYIKKLKPLKQRIAEQLNKR